MNIAHNLDINLLEIKQARTKHARPRTWRGWLTYLFA
jgi:hypothetical protein